MSTTLQDRRRVVCEGTVPVARPPEQALKLFTAEGERAWVAGWAPTYPAGRIDDATAPGVVWQTAHDHGRATWIVTSRHADRVSYAMVVDGVVAGTVAVACRAAADGGCAATVRYDLTALGPTGVDYVDAVASGFAARMRTWAEHIAQVPDGVPADVRTPPASAR